MTTYQWPSDVNYEQAAAGSTIPSTYRGPTVQNTESGVQILRRKPGPRATVIPWRSVPLTEAEAESIERFFRLVLLDGTLPFMMPVYRFNQGYVSRRCQLEDGKFEASGDAYPLIYVAFNLVVFNL